MTTAGKPHPPAGRGAQEVALDPARGPTGVQSVLRTFDVLEIISDAPGSVTLSELASASDLPMPTIHRLLRTLASRGYVRQLANRRYALGPRLIRLGEHASRQLGSLARLPLTGLVNRLGETANLAVLDSSMVLYVAQVPSRHSVRMFVEVGRVVHAHNTGVGKAILAQLDDESVRSAMARVGMPTPTARTIASVDQLLVELARIREQGFAIDDGEQEIGVRCVAVAVPGAPTPSAVSVSGPTARVDDAFLRAAIPQLRHAAREIADGLDDEF